MEPQTEGYVRVSPGNRAAAGRIGSVHRLFLGTTSVYTGYSAPGSEVASEAHQQSTGAHNVLSAREVLSASDDGWIDIFLSHGSRLDAHMFVHVRSQVWLPVPAGIRPSSTA